MQKPKLGVNIIPIDILQNEIEIGVWQEGYEGGAQFKPYSVPQEIELSLLHEIKQLRWDFQNIESAPEKFKIDLSRKDNRRFLLDFLNFLVFRFFQQTSKTVLLTSNFVGDTEIWLPDNNHSYPDRDCYKRFSIKVVANRISRGPSLRISFSDHSYVLKKTYADLISIIPSDHISKILYNDRVIKITETYPISSFEANKIRPIFNNSIRRDLGLDYIPRRVTNKYKRYYDEILGFYDNFLKSRDLFGVAKILASGFYNVPEQDVFLIPESSNQLLFKNNRTDYIPFNGIKNHGPLKGPDSSSIKFIFIYHSQDAQYANKTFLYLKKGYLNFPGLEAFVGIPFHIDVERSIKFDDENNPMPEIREKLSRVTFDDSIKYVAVYISRIKKDDPNSEKDEVYYKLKELLQLRHIVSQVIFKNNIDKSTFNYFLPNIAIALLAKLGGTPWRLNRPLKKDIIVGIGSYRPIRSRSIYIGNSFCFDNSGGFKGFDCFKDPSKAKIASDIKAAIIKYLEHNSSADRLIIHYYKPFGKQDEEPITKMLEDLKLDIPYFIITVNETESKDYVLFDNNYEGKMPRSGTFVSIGYNTFLVCNNTRYSETTGNKIDGFPFPIKVKVHSSRNELNDDMGIVLELVDQIYQFSRIYFKSVKQRALPVTIEYSSMLAEVFSHFESQELNDFSKNKLWFL